MYKLEEIKAGWEKLKREGIEAGLKPEYFDKFETPWEYMTHLENNFEAMATEERDEIAMRMGYINEGETIVQLEDGKWAACRKTILN